MILIFWSSYWTIVDTSKTNYGFISLMYRIGWIYSFIASHIAFERSGIESKNKALGDILRFKIKRTVGNT